MADAALPDVLRAAPPVPADWYGDITYTYRAGKPCVARVTQVVIAKDADASSPNRRAGA